MTPRFRPTLDALEAREVPAAFSFQLPDGSIGSGLFSTPDGADPAPGSPALGPAGADSVQASQSFVLTDLTMTKDGVAYAVDPGATATYANGVLVGVTATATGPDTIYLNGSTAQVDAQTAPLALDGAESELTFTLDDQTAGAISYTVPWDQVDATQESQSLELTNFNLNLAGQNISQSTPDVVFTVLPTVQFRNGVLVGVTFNVDTSALANFPYTSIWMNGGMQISAQPPVQPPPIGIPPPHVGQANQRAFLMLDFSNAKTGVSYRIDLVVKDANGNTLMSGPINIGAGASAEDIRDAVAASLGDTGLEVTIKPGNKLMIQSKGNKKLGQITYDTFTDVGNPAPTYAGPQILTQGGTSSLKVNGTVVNP